MTVRERLLTRVTQPQSYAAVNKSLGVVEAIGTSWAASGARLNLKGLHEEVRESGLVIAGWNNSHVLETTNNDVRSLRTFTVIFDVVCFYAGTGVIQTIVSAGGASTGHGWSVSLVGGTSLTQWRLTFGAVSDYSLSTGTLTNGESARLAVVVSRDVGTARYFKNGVLDSSRAVGTMNAPKNALTIGASWAGSTFINLLRGGSVSNVVIYNRALTDDEVWEESQNKWRAWEPRRILVPVSVGGGTPVTINTGTGAASAAGLDAGVASAITVAASTGAATGAGLSAGVSSPATVAASVGAATAAGLDAGIASPITVAAGTGAAVGAGLAASVASGATVSASVGAAVAVGLDAEVASPISLAANVGAATAAGLQASVSSGNEISTTTGAATAAGLQATVSGSVTISAGVGAATASGLQASVSTGATIQVGTGAAVALGLGATVTAETHIVAGVGVAVAAGFDAAVSDGTEVMPPAYRTMRARSENRILRPRAESRTMRAR